MRLPRFRLHTPRDVGQAVGLLDSLGDEATIIMGGTELVPLMKMGLAAPEHLIDGRGVTGLDALEVRDGALFVGAGVTHRRLETDPLVADLFPDLPRLERQIANVRVRASGTIGGNLCFAEPHSDPATLLLALGAVAQVAGVDGPREIDLSSFFLGPLQTALADDELLLGVAVPLPPAGTRVHFRRLALGERPVANVAAVLEPDGLRIALGAVGPRPVRAELAERALMDQGPAALEAAVQHAVDAAEPYDDLDGSKSYKEHLVGVLVRRAVSDVMVA